MSEQILAFQDVTKKYGDVLALNSLSFEIPSNKIIGLIGANGAGKTTILKHIIKYLRPDSGTILLAGQDIYSFPDVAFPISFIPDTPVYYEELTIMEHLHFIAAMYNTEEKIDDLISALDLSNHLNKVPGALSKGTLQKLMIACALLRSYDLLIADEPFSGLDPKQIMVLKDLLLKDRDVGKTVILSTHLLATIENICDYYVFIDNGQLLGMGSLEDLIAGNTSYSLEDIYMILSQNMYKEQED